MKTFSALYFLTLFAPVLSSQEIRLLLEMPGVGKPSYRYESLGRVADVRQLAVPFVGERVLALDGQGQVHEWRRKPTEEFSGDWRVLDAPGGVKKIAVGSRHTMLLLEDGTVWTAGGNSDGQLGDGSLADRVVFRRVGTLPEISCIAAGSNFSLALDRTGRVWAWGANWTGVIPGEARKLVSWPTVLSGIPSARSVIVRADAPFTWNGSDVWSWGMIEYPEKRIQQSADGRLLSDHLLTSKEQRDVVRGLKLELSNEGVSSELLWWPGLEDVYRMIEIGVQRRGALSVNGQKAVAGWAVAWLNETAAEGVASLSFESRNRNPIGETVKTAAPDSIADTRRSTALAPRQAVGFSLPGSYFAVGQAAGNGSVTITSDFSWSASSSASWLTLGASSGTGSGPLGYSYTANTNVASRFAVIIAAGYAYTIAQAGATVTLTENSATVAPSASTGAFGITVTPAADWTAASSDGWLTVTQSSGTGSATLNYNLTANTGTSGRMATITVAGQKYTVMQAATSGAFTPWGVGAYGVIRRIAGTGAAGSGGDGGPATSAQLASSYGVAVDGSGNVYIADSYNYRIRKVTAATGIITTLAGTGTAGFSGDGGPATSAQLNLPYGVAVDGSGNVYIADSSNNAIRKINAATGIITTIAGGSSFGDGGPAFGAELRNPSGVAVDGFGNLYIAERLGSAIRKIDGVTGIITTIAIGFSWKQIYSVAVDGVGNVYFPSFDNCQVMKLTAATGIITTIAGTGSVGYTGDGGAATSAQLKYPVGVAVDGGGNVYIADSSNNRIRKISATTGIITTIAGTGSLSSGGDGGSATSALLGAPYGLAVDGVGNVYNSSASSRRTRFIDYTTPQVIKPALKVGAFGSGYWVQDLNGNFAWDGLSVDRRAFFSAGQAGEVPVSGDWNGDGKDKLGTYIDGTWILDYNGNGQWDGAGVDKLVFFGGLGWTPVVGDWNGDGKAKIGVYKDGTWMLDYDGNYAWNPPTDKLLFWGGVGYTPVLGDWNNSGWTKIGVHKQGLWLLDYDGDFAWNAAIDKTVFFGGPGYTPVVGDWNGSGNTKIGATLDGLWVIDYNGNFQWDGLVTDKLVFFGGAGWTPMVGDWDGNGKVKVGAYKDGTWVLDVNGNFTWDPPPDQLIFFGGPGQTPVAGKW